MSPGLSVFWHVPLDYDVAVIYFSSASSYTWESTWSLIPKLNGFLWDKASYSMSA